MKASSSCSSCLWSSSKEINLSPISRNCDSAILCFPLKLIFAKVITTLGCSRKNLGLVAGLAVRYTLCSTMVFGWMSKSWRLKKVNNLYGVTAIPVLLKKASRELLASDLAAISEWEYLEIVT